MRFDLNVRIEPSDRGAGLSRLFLADVAGRKNDLPLQIRQRHMIVIDDANRADAGGGEIMQYRRAKPAGADDQHARGFELLLAGAADLAQHDVARVTFQFLGLEHRG